MPISCELYTSIDYGSFRKIGSCSILVMEASRAEEKNSQLPSTQVIH